MASNWGEHLKISLFGESHGPVIGVVMDGVPAGEALDLQAIYAFMQRRAPGHTPWSTSRREEDIPKILSGFYQGQTTGTPLAAILENKDTRSKDYEKFAQVPRPSHADYTGQVRYRGANDPRGGGHFSGRLTAPLCFAGAVCLEMLKRCGIRVLARIAEIGGIEDIPLDLAKPDEAKLRVAGLKPFPAIDDNKGQEMIAFVEKAKTRGDSVGGIVQCFVLGLPPGLGDPMFGGVESRLASLLYGIPAVKGVSFGAGFAAARRFGSENNDFFTLGSKGQIQTLTNHEGGINGGITNGMPLSFKVAIKPTASIALPQQSVNLENMTEETLIIQGRHDPCIVPRALVAVEAAAACVMVDLMLGAFGSIKGER